MRFLPFIMLIGMMALLCFGSGSSSSFKVEDEDFHVEEWVDAWVEIWNTYDLNQVDKLFLQDERVTYFSSEKEGFFLCKIFFQQPSIFKDMIFLFS